MNKHHSKTLLHVYQLLTVAGFADSLLCQSIGVRQDIEEGGFYFADDIHELENKKVFDDLEKFGFVKWEYQDSKSSFFKEIRQHYVITEKGKAMAESLIRFKNL